MIYQKIFAALIIASAVFLFLPSEASALKTYGNRTETVTLSALAPKPLNLTANLTINDKINHTFQMDDVGSTATFTLEYVAGNRTGYLLKLTFDDFNNRIQLHSCDGTSQPDFCTGGCGDFAAPTNFTVFFNPSTSKADIYSNYASLGSADICQSIVEIDYVNITGTGSTQMSNNIVIANNKPPQFIGNLPNITWPEDTSTSFNISGNFSDPNNDTLTFSYTAVNNISISINNNTGIVNLTPDNGFFGVRYAKFIADDGDNTTFSNNVTLNVTAVNNLPSATSATISNSDFLNRTNGSLTASWTFSDSDNDVMLGNETLWHINGIENESLRNLTAISSSNTTKNQNWSFSVRVFDGTNFSAFFSSANITIANALQSFNPALGVESAERNTLFTYDINYTDLDGDIATFSDNSSLFAITNEGIINFTPTASGNITVNITLSQNPNVSGILTIEVSDNLAPTVTAISASSSGTPTVTVTLSVTTDETAICNFAASDLNFSSMSQMSSTSSTSHSNSQSFASDTSGTYYVRCNDTFGNVMNSSSSAAFNADIQEPSSGGGGSGNSGGNSGWSCRYKVECTAWSECVNGKQTRGCENVAVVPFYSETKCEYLLKQEKERKCEAAKKEKEEPEEIIEPNNSEDSEEAQEDGKQGLQSITGRLISDLGRNFKLKHGFIAFGIVIAALSIFFYHKYFNNPVDLSEEEMEKLRKILQEK